MYSLRWLCKIHGCFHKKKKKKSLGSIFSCCFSCFCTLQFKYVNSYSASHSLFTFSFCSLAQISGTIQISAAPQLCLIAINCIYIYKNKKIRNPKFPVSSVSSLHLIQCWFKLVSRCNQPVATINTQDYKLDAS